jgi:ELWxxDGT repeat protein
LYFTADDGTDGRELWTSDGTPAGTAVVQDINPGPGNAFYTFYDPGFTVVNSQLFFVANDRVHGRELWVYTPDSASTADVPRGHTLPAHAAELALADAPAGAPSAAVPVAMTQLAESRLDEYFVAYTENSLTRFGSSSTERPADSAKPLVANARAASDYLNLAIEALAGMGREV